MSCVSCRVSSPKISHQSRRHPAQFCIQRLADSAGIFALCRSGVPSPWPGQCFGQVLDETQAASSAPSPKKPSPKKGSRGFPVGFPRPGARLMTSQHAAPGTEKGKGKGKGEGGMTSPACVVVVVVVLERRPRCRITTGRGRTIAFAALPSPGRTFYFDLTLTLTCSRHHPPPSSPSSSSSSQQTGRVRSCSSNGLSSDHMRERPPPATHTHTRANQRSAAQRSTAAPGSTHTNPSGETWPSRPAQERSCRTVHVSSPVTMGKSRA